jgi:nucleotide-binding universal stress UspA family protein
MNELLVVVGYDGSTGAGGAVDWAAAEAWRRGAGLLVVTVSDASNGEPDEGVEAWPSAELQAARRTAGEGAERARKAFPELRTMVAAPYRHPAEALIELSRGTELLVVGASGHGQLAGTLLGSVAFSVIAHAGCPVVVVRGDSERAPGPGAPVVLAIDGADTCPRAVEFAGRVADGCGAALTVVHVWAAVPAGGFAGAYWPEVEPHIDGVVADSQAMLRAVATRLLERHPGLIVRTRAVQGHPVSTLPTVARDEGAALLVAGARGRGGFAGLLLGSVSRGLILTAPCPVAVVRDGS